MGDCFEVWPRVAPRAYVPTESLAQSFFSNDTPGNPYENEPNSLQRVLAGGKAAWQQLRMVRGETGGSQGNSQFLERNFA